MKVLVHPSTELRKRSLDIPVDEIETVSLRTLIDELKQTMIAENGVGIAAPQVGVHKRVIIVETPEGPQAFINPRITQKSLRKIESEEGCLSVPGIFGIVRRHRSITVEAFNEQGQWVTMRADHFPAIVFQHEIDHLDGILFVDKVVRYTTHPKI